MLTYQTLLQPQSPLCPQWSLQHPHQSLQNPRQSLQHPQRLQVCLLLLLRQLSGQLMQHQLQQLHQVSQQWECQGQHLPPALSSLPRTHRCLRLCSHQAQLQHRLLHQLSLLQQQLQSPLQPQLQA